MSLNASETLGREALESESPWLDLFVGEAGVWPQTMPKFPVDAPKAKAGCAGGPAGSWRSSGAGWPKP